MLLEMSAEAAWKWYVVEGVRPMRVIECELTKESELEAVP